MNGVFYCRNHENEHLRITPEAEALNRTRLGHNLRGDNNGCWLWTGTRNDGGYGTFVPEGANTARWLAHRVAWGLLMGGHKPGLELDHRTCKQRLCVNPLHLEPVTRSTNQKRKRHGPDGGWNNPNALSNPRIGVFAEQHGLPMPSGPAVQKDSHIVRRHRPVAPSSITRKTNNAPPDSRRNLPRQRVRHQQRPLSKPRAL